MKNSDTKRRCPDLGAPPFSISLKFSELYRTLFILNIFMDSSGSFSTCSHRQNDSRSTSHSVTSGKYARTCSGTIFISHKAATTSSLKPCSCLCNQRVRRCSK